MRLAYLLFILVVGLCGCGGETTFNHPFGSNGPVQTFERPATDNISSEPIRRVLESAREQITTTTHYTQDYRVIPYPGGDMPADTGACTDVVIRAFRKAGVDLQKEVHEDMAANFPA